MKEEKKKKNKKGWGGGEEVLPLYMKEIKLLLVSKLHAQYNLPAAAEF
jgi:hypothetical protein